MAINSIHAAAGPVVGPSKAQVWTGRVLWILAVPFLIMDIGIHLANPPMVSEAIVKFGFAPSFGPILGAIQLVCLALYLIPRTAALGAVLLTAYLGGAVVTHVQDGSPFWFAILMACLLWGSLYCRDARVRALIR